MTTKRETPILASVLNAFGVATTVIAIVGGAVMSLGDSFRGGIVVILGGVFEGLICVGIAQVVNFLARTESSTKQVCAILESSITERLRAIENSCFASPLTPKLAGANARYIYFDDEDLQGPVEANALRMMRKDGLVSEDTPVLREGETEWRSFRDFLALNR
jgi:hypothetical protein